MNRDAEFWESLAGHEALEAAELVMRRLEEIAGIRSRPQRTGTLAYEHRTDAALRLNGPDTQDAIQRVLEWSASTPVWKANWVPEFSAWDCEVAGRAWGVILDESRLHWPGGAE